ncbi:hypothetical protein FOPG_20135 [Fusarium oxysporum f. sp. conglutinans race 2 54008]|uniref:Uncharacterized protein n=1 Tax=Fusarium oxysporum f. sp. conglutinans race 2 54008 TaxID=1089457 RepID=X0GUQ9_FUSOX|nr:hypothetical protein FOPG_20135 [Fusarium oxysporum f. sp. conglutinans race 2 54008]
MPNGDWHAHQMGAMEASGTSRINCKSKLTWLVRDGPGRGLDSQQTGLSGTAYGILATMRSGFFEIQIK